ncbi:MAG TPA: proteasome ATPase [Actinomycetota bacterium]|nr:proteasome ATPase [Actinomycetota bacterium]
MPRQPEFDRRIAEFEREVGELQMQVKILEEEAGGLRAKLADAPIRIRELEAHLLEARAEYARSREQSERMTELLRQAREQIVTLREEVEKLSSPPSGYGVFLTAHEDGTVDVFTGGRKLRVKVAPEVEVATLAKGQELLLNEALNVVAACGFEIQGEVVSLKELIENYRAIVISHADEERVVALSEPLRDSQLRSGDLLMLDTKSGYVLEKLPKPEVEELILEEVPDVSYEAIGGLDAQIEALRDAVELPFIHADLFADHQLTPPKGVLLYGPPGCGKTLIAKAVANSLAKRSQETTGRDVRAYFLNVKGPELLNKYVGETERQIRLIFQRAKEKSAEGVPVIVFFDEMESLFRTRGSGISSDIETTIVPQLLSEIDGVELLKNVIVIGASNREDLIDPAILRPGRLDVKIKIERPDEAAAGAILGKYLTPEVPIHPLEISSAGNDIAAAIRSMIRVTVAEMYAVGESNEFLEVTYANGDKEILYFKDFASGAMMENIVRRAKKLAIKRLIATGERGLKTDDLLESIVQEYRENEDLPNTTNPDDWAKISGKKGERIVYVRTLVGESKKAERRSIERLQTGQYL